MNRDSFLIRLNPPSTIVRTYSCKQFMNYFMKGRNKNGKKKKDEEKEEEEEDEEEIVKKAR